MAEQAGAEGAARNATVVAANDGPVVDDRALAVARENEHKAEIKSAQTAVQRAEDALTAAKARLAELEGTK